MKIAPASCVALGYVLIFATNSVAGRVLCEMKRSQWRHALKDSAYLQLSAADYPSCLINCIKDFNCLSLTYDMLRKRCMLSKETRWTKPLHYRSNVSNSIYMEMIETKERCQKKQGGQSPTTMGGQQATSGTPTTQQPTSGIPTTEQTTSGTPTAEQTTSGTPTTEQTTSGIPTTQSDGIKFCIGKRNGDYLHPTDCTKYITYSNAITYVRECFNAVTEQCGKC